MRSHAAVLAVAIPVALGGCRQTRARIDVSQAPNRKESFLTLDGATILFDKGGAYDRLCSSLPNGGRTSSKGQSGCVDHHFYVLPIVPTGWSPSDPVPAWATCSRRETSLDECVGASRTYAGDVSGKVMIRARTGGQGTGWDDAVKDATQRHGLRVADGSPVLELGKQK